MPVATASRREEGGRRESETRGFFEGAGGGGLGRATLTRADQEHDLLGVCRADRHAESLLHVALPFAPSATRVFQKCRLPLYETFFFFSRRPRAARRSRILISVFVYEV